MTRIESFLLNFVEKQQLYIPASHKFISVEYYGKQIEITALIDDQTELIYRNIHICQKHINSINVHHAEYIGTLKGRDGFFIGRPTYYIIAGDTSDKYNQNEDQDLLKPVKLPR